MRVVVIGTGAIGKRYLQGLSQLADSVELYYYDRDSGVSQSVPTFLESCSIASARFCDLNECGLVDHIDRRTVVVLATTADSRFDMLNRVLDCHPFAILAEKPLVRTIDDYEVIQKKSTLLGIPIFVNFLSHMMPIYRELATELIGESQINVNVSLPSGWGMACVGIHSFELFTWLSKAASFEIQESKIVDVFRQKRQEFYDIAGHIKVSNLNGSSLVVSSNSSTNLSSVEIRFGNRLCSYYELQEKVIKIGPRREFSVANVKAPLVSLYVAELIPKIFENAPDVHLPTIEECFPAHQMLFEFLKENKLDQLNFT